MEPQFTSQSKPALVNVIAWMTLASGIVNLFWGLIASISVAVTFVGLLCTPFTILPTVLGIFEIIYAAKLLSNPPQPIQPSTTIAILEIVCILAFNVFSVVVGILSLVFYNDITVRDYFARLNGTPIPVAPAVPVAPPPTSEPEPVEAAPQNVPITPEESAPVEPAPAEEVPAPEETPKKPKRTRKVAKK